MFRAAALVSFAFIAAVYGQQAGTNTAETHPALPMQQCTAAGCTTLQTSVVLDSNWRWLHEVGGYTNCYTGNEWDATLCPDPVTCAANCALDGADYVNTYGITASSDALTLKFVTGSNVGSRVYLLDNPTTYHLFKLKNQEFTFDVDVSGIGCGINGALYLIQMDADGGLARFPGNKAGAKYGTGYCDSQCPQDIKFIDGEANILNWNTTGANTGTGEYGTCCSEMDIWEANNDAAAYTPHPCSVTEQTQCSGEACGAGPDRYDGVCDHDGCDFNSYRLGSHNFFGKGLTVDTSKPFTVVTQFLTADNTSTGDLTEIRRLYVQNGAVIANSVTNVPGIDPVNSITEDFCDQEKATFGDTPNFQTQGGLTQMGKALDTGMVLALSIWDDSTAGMYWLDSDYPLTANASAPGVARGTCSTTSGNPATLESTVPNSQVIFSNIKVGSLGSTYPNGPVSVPPTSVPPTSVPPTSVPPTSVPPTSVPPTNPSGTPVAEWGQCGGIGYTGSTVCAAPYTCHVLNPYYSQCY